MHGSCNAVHFAKMFSRRGAWQALALSLKVDVADVGVAVAPDTRGECAEAQLGKGAIARDQGSERGLQHDEGFHDAASPGLAGARSDTLNEAAGCAV